MYKSSLIFVYLISYNLILFAQDTLVFTKKIVYKNAGDRELCADMFYTQSSQQKSDNSAIVFFHGGGWVFGSPSEFYEACRRYAKRGFVTFSFQYRLSRNNDGSYPHPDITPIKSSKDARSTLR